MHGQKNSAGGGGDTEEALQQWLNTLRPETGPTFCTWQPNKVRNMRGRLTVCDMQIQHNLSIYYLCDSHTRVPDGNGGLSVAAGAHIYDNNSRVETQQPRRSEVSSGLVSEIARRRSHCHCLPQISIWCAIVTACDNHFRGILINATRVWLWDDFAPSAATEWSDALTIPQNLQGLSCNIWYFVYIWSLNDAQCLSASRVAEIDSKWPRSNVVNCHQHFKGFFKSARYTPCALQFNYAAAFGVFYIWDMEMRAGGANLFVWPVTAGCLIKNNNAEHKDSSERRYSKHHTPPWFNMKPIRPSSTRSFFSVIRQRLRIKLAAFRWNDGPVTLFSLYGPFHQWMRVLAKIERACYTKQKHNQLVIWKFWNWVNISSGVPQGSVGRPLLFSLFTHGTSKILKHRCKYCK